MNKRKQRIVLIFVLIGMLLFSGCSNNSEDHSFILDMIRGDLNGLYLNEWDDNYLNLCDMTKEEGEKLYAEGIRAEAEFFSYYWGIIDDGEVMFEDLDEKLQEEIYAICDTISKKTKFEVKSAKKENEESYLVKVTVEPIDIMEKADVLYETYGPLNDFWERTKDVDYMTIPLEEYVALRNEYGFIMVEIMKQVLPELGYQKEKSLEIHVEMKDGYWTTKEEDLAVFYEYHLTYPY